MSLFKIVGNYYEDILDYFTKEYKKLDTSYDPVAMEREYLRFQDNPMKSPILSKFKEQFMKIFEIPREKIAKKTEITKLLALTYMKLDRLKESDAHYWDSKAATYTYIRAIMIIMLFILAYLILIYLRKFSLEGIDDRITILQTNVAYVTVFTIIFTIFLIFIINLSEKIKMSHDRAVSHSNQFTNFHLLLVPNIQFQLFFTALGYIVVNNQIVANRIFKKLNETSQRGESKDDNTHCGVNTSTKIKKYVLNKDPCKNRTNLDEIYDDLKQDIADYIFQFYNYGHGYSTLRKAVVKSNNNYMLREVRNILSFYYYLINKKGDYDVEKSVIENDRKILDKILVKKLETLQLSYFLDGSVDGTSKNTSVIDNEDVESNPAFVTALGRFQNAIIYLGMFLYPLYLKESPTSAAPVYLYLPQNITGEEKDQYKLQTKEYFIKKADERYNEMLAMVKGASPSEFNMLIADYIQQFADYITTYVHDLIMVIKGADLFVLDEKYIVDKIDVLYKLVPFAYVDSTYKNIYKEAFIKVLLPVVKTNIFSNLDINNNSNPTINNMLAFKESLILESLAEELSRYKINIREHMNYVLDKVIKESNVDDKLLIIYKRILLKLDQAIELKKKMKRTKDDVKPRFISGSEFNNRLGEISFADITKGLGTQYLYEILNDFYMEVSGAIGTSENTSSPTNRTEFNIFYKKQQNFKMASYLVFMIIAFIIPEAFVYYMIGWSRGLAELKDERKKLNPELPNYKTIKAVYRTKSVNHWIKLLIPLTMTFFVMAMLYSYNKKAVDKFEFNRDTIETNTSDLLDTITRLDTQLGIIQQSIGNKSHMRITDLKEITDDAKAEIYKNILDLVDKYEKCNYIINVSQNYIPFPYTEITIDAFMIAASVLCFVYIFGQLSPLERLKKIKKLNKMREDIAFVPELEMTKLVDLEKACNDEELDTIAFTLKIIVFSFIMMFLIFYTITIVTSTSNFKNGLYNSAYFEESRCYNG